MTSLGKGICILERRVCDGLSFIEQMFTEHLLCSRRSSRLGNTGSNKTEKLLPRGVHFLVAASFFFAIYSPIYQLLSWAFLKYRNSVKGSQKVLFCVVDSHWLCVLWTQQVFSVTVSMWVCLRIHQTFPCGDPLTTASLNCFVFPSG